MEVTFLRVKNGDAIHIRLTDGTACVRNILIDSGTGDAYNIKSKKKDYEGALKTCVDQIKKREECIDLLILTHVDDDHIGGVLKWFESQPQLAGELIGEVWFNSGRLIFEHFGKPEDVGNLIKVRFRTGNMTSTGQGVAFEDHITALGIWHRQIIQSGDVITRFGVAFTILSPNELRLAKLLKKWEREQPHTLTSSCADDYETSLVQHLESYNFTEDTADHNGSSIAFIMSFHDENYLFLADAHPSVVVSALEGLGYTPEHPLKAKFVKLSHHGSSGNTSKALLSLVDTDQYIVSTSGDIHCHPHKKLFAQLISHHAEKGQGISIYFNYPELIERIFTKDDYDSFTNFKTLPTNQIDL